MLLCAIEKKFKSKDYGLVPRSPGHLRWLPSLDCHDCKYFDKICLKNDFSIVSKVHLAFKKVFFYLFYLFNVNTMFCTRFVLEKRKYKMPFDSKSQNAFDSTSRYKKICELEFKIKSFQKKIIIKPMFNMKTVFFFCILPHLNRSEHIAINERSRTEIHIK